MDPDRKEYDRLIETKIREALSDTPVVLIVGPRRAGKTTVVRKIGGDERRYLTLDDPSVLAAARSDPVAFLRELDRATIDEVQRAPELLLAVKKSVDEDYRPGRFLLTGSANVLTLPRLADSLAGRMETIRMLPLAQAEVLGRIPSFPDRLFGLGFQKVTEPVVGTDLVRLVLRGGYPEAVARGSERRRQDWGRSYLTAVLTRDLRDIAVIEKLTDMPRFVRILAQHASQLVNFSEVGRAIQANHKTVQRYVGLLERIYLLTVLQPWHTNSLKRLIKTPKLQFLDAGLLATSRGTTIERCVANRSEFGPLLETFVFSEVLKLLEGSSVVGELHHFRDHQGREVDLVLERNDGQIAGMEVKASATVASGDFSGLRTLAEAYPERFVRGIVLYDGEEVVPFGDRLAAVPISCLWS